MSDDLQVLLTEHRKFDPPAEFRADAAISSTAIYDRGSENMER